MLAAMVRAMSATKKILLAMLLGGVTASGCMYVAVTPSVAGRAYVVKKQGGYLGKSELWNCDATTGTPTCYEVKNVANGPVPTPTTATQPSPATTATAGGADQ
jgi:hypothetical protein